MIEITTEIWCADMKVALKYFKGKSQKFYFGQCYFSINVIFCFYVFSFSWCWKYLKILIKNLRFIAFFRWAQPLTVPLSVYPFFSVFWLLSQVLLLYSKHIPLKRYTLGEEGQTYLFQIDCHCKRKCKNSIGWGQT